MGDIIVFGAAGQLGQCLKKVAAERNITKIHFLPEDEADVLNTDAIKKTFEEYKPAFVINCAAYTAVDKAEDDVDLARKINKTGAYNLAIAAKAANAVLVHVSTDFIFKGDKPNPLVEDDIAEPLNVYGITKLEGEQDIVNILDEHFIVRTSWLYSEYGNNFVKTMLKLGAERDILKIIADQVGTPCYGIDLAGCLLDMILSGKKEYGIYHYSNEGVASWYDFAKAIFDLSATQVELLPINTSEYPTNATRPAYSVMDKTKIKHTFGLKIPYWRDSLATCIERLEHN